MSEEEKSSVAGKVIAFFLLLAVVKLIHILFNSSSLTFALGSISLLIIFFLIAGFIVVIFGNNYSSQDSSSSGGSFSLGDDKFEALRRRYEELCDDFVSKKEYKKAAYVQMKLLQNPYRAASILKDGKYYNDAAFIYKKRCKDKSSAAECYFLGRSYKKSIDLYKELNMNEKVGDIYTAIKEPKKANEFYNIVVDDYKSNGQYIYASKVLKDKIKDSEMAQLILFKGWNENKDAENCLNYYLNEYQNSDTLLPEINRIYGQHVNQTNELKFLSVLKTQHKKEEKIRENTQELAYKIIAKNSHKKSIVSNLKDFVLEDNKIVKDVAKFNIKS